MKRTFVNLMLALVAAASVFASEASGVCTTSDMTADSCCCIVQDGQMICPMTGEVVDSCCCE